MRRNMDLIRLLLLQVEGEDPKPDLSEYSEEQQLYHMTLCIEADLVDGAIVRNSDGYPAQTIAIRLTWKGHEVLDAARNETSWKKAGEHLKKSGVQVTMSILEELLKKLLKEPLGLP